MSGRAVAATWWVFCFIIVASYTANLAAFLTSARLNKGILNMEDLGSQFDVKYAPADSSDSAAFFRSMSDIEISFYDLWRALSQDEVSGTPQDRAKYAIWQYPLTERYTQIWRYMLAQGLSESSAVAVQDTIKSESHEKGFAFLGDTVWVSYSAATNCEVEAVGPIFDRKPLAIGVAQGNDALRIALSNAILDLKRDEYFEGLWRRWWKDNHRILRCPVEDDESDGVSMGNMGGIFIVVIIGTVAAVLVVLFQLQIGSSVVGAPKVAPVSLSQTFSHTQTKEKF